MAELGAQSGNNFRFRPEHDAEAGTDAVISGRNREVKANSQMYAYASYDADRLPMPPGLAG